MKNKKIYLILLLCTLIVTLYVINVNAEQSRSYNWYCVHRKGHLQPRADSNISFVEKYEGYYIDKAHGDYNDEKVIYLTFDAGYENGNVEKIMDVLKKENVNGAFFILGNLINKNTALVTRMFEDGHLVCNHTFSHKSMIGKTKTEFERELLRLEDLCYEKTGFKMSKLYRPPEGRFDETTMCYAYELGYKTIFWSFAYADWDNNKQMSPDVAKKKILDNIHNGEIMLLHPTSETNAKIIEDIIIELKNQGYRFGCLNELSKEA